MSGARLLGVVLAVSVVGCGAAEHEYVRPWFRMTTSPRHVIAPHAIEWGGGRHAEVLVDGSWHELEHSDCSAHPVGDAVAITEYTFVDPGRRDPINDAREQGASGVYIYREGRVEPIHIPPERCATPEYSKSPPEIACFGCGAEAPYSRLSSSSGSGGSCGTLHLDTFDPLGRAISRLVFSSPILGPSVEGRIPNGPWILAEQARRDDFLYFGAPSARFSLDASGIVALPFGADPLHVERNAAGRAAEIIREVPIRDAAVASLRGAFADDERAHPTWEVRAEVLNRLQRNSAMEPSAPAEPGGCYTIVARASEGVTRLELSIHASTPYVPESIEAVHEGVLGFATGAPEVTVSRCFSPGYPTVYHYRVGSRGGSGYVMARVYAHPPEASR